jgi:P pilus assembly chaperone PapD
MATEKDLMHRTNRFHLMLLLILATIVGISERTSATLVAPHALFIDHRVRSAAIYLHNPDDKPVEIGIELVYGYPRGNGDGGVSVFLQPEPPADEPSCAEWVRALPRRVLLQPGQRQTVRLLARPPAGLPDGEYWSRVVISSKPLAREEDAVEVEGHEGVRVGLTLSTRTVISLNYRKGPVSTGLDVESLSASLGADAITASMELKRLGDAAWLGQVDAVLLDSDGTEMQRWDQILAVYDDHRRVLHFPLRRPKDPGSYMLSLTWSTDRKDLPPEEVLAATTVIRAVPLVAMSPPGR